MDLQWPHLQARDLEGGDSVDLCRSARVRRGGAELAGAPRRKELDEGHLAGGNLLVVVLGKLSARHRGHGHGAQRRRAQPASHVGARFLGAWQ